MSDQRTQWEFLANDKLSAILDRIDAKFTKVEASTARTESKMTRFFSGFAGAAFAINNVFGAIQQVGNMLDATFGKSLRLANSFEQTKIAFETFTGDAQLGDALLFQLKHLADTTVLQNQATYDAGRTLLGFGVAADQVLPVMKELGDISGGNNDKLQALTLAFAQMTAAGKLMGQDVLQFVNAGFNPLHEISVMTGKSMMQLRKEMEAGTISSAQVAAAFAHATAEGGLFFHMMDKQSETSAGKLSVLQSNWNNFLMALGQGMQPLENKLIDLGSALVNGLGAGLQWLENNGGTINEILTQMGILVGTLVVRMIALNAEVIIANIGFALWAAKYYLLTAAQWALNLAMNANPIGLIITGIGLLIMGLVAAYNHSQKFRAALAGIGAVVKVVGGILVGYGKIIIGIMTFNKDLITSGADQFANSVSEIASKGIGGIFNEGYNASVVGEVLTNAKGWGQHESIYGKDTLPGSTKPGGPTANDGVKGVAEGGRSPKNIIVNIKEVNGIKSLVTTTIKEGMGNLKNKISELLIREIRDAEVAVSSGE